MASTTNRSARARDDEGTTLSRKKRPDCGADATGRSKLDDKHIRLYRRALDSAAYLALSSGARALLIELTKLYNGSNNGRIALGVRLAATLLGCGKTKIVALFDELIAKGFIKAAGKGTFNSKGGHASEWTLTDYPTIGQPATPPTRDYLRWTGTDFPTPQRAPRKPTLAAVRKQNLGPHVGNTPILTCGQTDPDVRTVSPEPIPTCGHFGAESDPNRSRRADTHNNQARGQGAVQGDGEQPSPPSRPPEASSAARTARNRRASASTTTRTA